jgi:hypothetical protein
MNVESTNSSPGDRAAVNGRQEDAEAERLSCIDGQ